MIELKASHPLALQFLLTEDLYLVDEIEQGEIGSENQKEAEVEEPSPTDFNYLGENNKYFLLLVNDPVNKYLAAKELDALQNILSAKKLELKDVAILNLKNYPSANFTQLKAFFALSKLVLFGVDPGQLQLPSFPQNKTVEHEGTKILNTFKFSEMMEDVNKKKLFWTEMKAL